MTFHTSGRAARAVTRLAGLLLGLVFLALAATGPGAGRAAAQARAPSQAERQPVQVLLDGITPKAPRAGSTVEITGQLVNASKRPVRDLTVRLGFSLTPFVRRGQLETYAKDGGLAVPPVFGVQAKVADTLAPGASAPWSLRVTTKKLGLRGFGVYPLAVEALSGPRRVDVLRTFLPFMPDKVPPKPTRVAWLWPIFERPHRSDDVTFIDDDLSRTLAPDGRLGQLVSAPAKAGQGTPPVPLTWAIDPAVLQAAQDMTDGYTVRPPSGKGTKHEPSTSDASETAKEWLDRLRDATKDEKVLSMPYADPDVMALHRAGLDKDLTFAVTKGPSVAEDVLGRDVVHDAVWPPAGWLDQDTLDSLTVAGVHSVILNDHALPPEQQLTFTPNAGARTPTIGGTAQAFIADGTLTDILGSNTRRPGGAALTEQRFLAETALITAELPYQERTLLVTPPRRWNPGPDFAAAVLKDTASVPWLRPVDLSDIASPGSSDIARRGLLYPSYVLDDELDPHYLAQVRAMDRDLERFTSILAPRSSSFDFAILRTESSAWRGHRKLGERLHRAVRASLDRQRDKVQVLTRGPLLLAGSTGTVPVTIANNLSDRSVTLNLAVIPRNHAWLEIGDYTKQLQIDPRHKVTVKVPMTAVATGVTQVTLQLLTPDGTPYGDAVNVKVKANGYGTTALAITGGAFAVLFLAVGVRLVRRALQRGSETDEGGAGSAQ